MVDLLCRPFICQIDGHEVSLTQDDSTIMMEKSTIQAIMELLFDVKEAKVKVEILQCKQNVVQLGLLHFIKHNFETGD